MGSIVGWGGSWMGSRSRRRAVLRGQGETPDRQVLVEWFSGADVEARLVKARRRIGLCHVNLARLLSVGRGDGTSGFAISEAPVGIDLLTLLRAARENGGLPAWWTMAVIAAAGRGLLALHQWLGGPRGLAVRHGAVSSSSIFVGWGGEVQLLAFSPASAWSASSSSSAALPAALFSAEAPSSITPDVGAIRPGGPGGGMETDVAALGRLLLDLLPAEAKGDPAIAGRLGAVVAPNGDRDGNGGRRASLADLLAVLSACLLEQDAPAARKQAIGERVGALCPRDTVDFLDSIDPADHGEEQKGSSGDRRDEAAQAATPTSSSARSAVRAPTAAPLRRTRWPARVLLGLSGGLLLAALWAGSVAIAPRGAADDRVEATPGALLGVAATAGRSDVTAEWRGLRVSIVGHDGGPVRNSEQEPDRAAHGGRTVAVLLRLVNSGRQPVQVPLAEILLASGDSPPLAPRTANHVMVAPGRSMVAQLEFPHPPFTGPNAVLLLPATNPEGRPTVLRLPRAAARAQVNP